MNVSIIIPVYNRAQKLKKAVDSVLAQTYESFELIVIDDGSDDDPAKNLSGIDDKRLRIFRQPNKGVSAARNRGIKESTNEWLAFLDSDDTWLETKLEEQVAFHKENPRLLISQTDEVWIKNGVRINPNKLNVKQAGDIFQSSLSRCMISPSAVILHRSLFDEVGLFDESLVVCEDYDLWLRITCRHSVGLIKDKLVIKTGGHPDQLSKKYWGMDRFRVKAIEKLIENNELTVEQEKAAAKVLVKKLDILKNGAKKRNKDGAEYDSMINKYKVLAEKVVTKTS
ncbi:hypothetical protein LCGC14_1475530 [marine sediment metagenome]|uniref:Glycosyltransferase 2-like domain-containing protein n=1 Tax=marine sediment metagenome TaxID=412755 RepID=A0A0F9LRL2_9ZZZZ